MSNKIKISFWGACQETTGSNFVLESDIGGKKTKIIIDCGFFQGSKINDDRNYEPFKYDLSDIDAAIITHAHLDHVGRVPKLIKEGFRGKIYSTPATRDLGELMLIDSMGVLQKEANRNGKKKLIYDEFDIKKTMEQWEGVEYDKEFAIGDLKINLKDAGHILGSAIVEIIANGKKIVFSGDLGNSPEPLLRDTEKITNADYVIIESTYGDRMHESRKEGDLKLERAIEDTIHKKGVLMIPAFSLERTQMILYQINELIENGRVPRAPVFLDSPLSIKATIIYKEYTRYFNQATKKILLSDDIFSFPGFKNTLKTDESKQINEVHSPKIIIAGSGMCNGGRILHHLRRYLPDQNSTLLLSSYQAPGSLGRQLSEGARIVNIIGEDTIVRAKLERIEGYSSHTDSEGLYDFLKNSADTAKKVFVVHGELKSSLHFIQRIRDYMGINAIAPAFGESFEIDI